MAEAKRLPNGRWKIRYRDPQGRPRSKVCDTKAEARDHVQDIGHAGRTRTWVAPELGRITLEQWAGQYMSTVVHLRPTTVWLYERELEYILTGHITTTRHSSFRIFEIRGDDLRGDCR